MTLFSQRSALMNGIIQALTGVNPMEKLYATAELQVIPLGAGVSVRKQVKRVLEVLNRYDLVIETHASGTNIEGEMSVILDAVQSVHKLLHEDGELRLISYLKLETRTDKKPTLAGKKL